MAVSQADIDALNQAIATGERQVTHGGKSVTYRSISELVAARDALREELAAEAARTSGRRRSRISYLTYKGRGFQ